MATSGVATFNLTFVDAAEEAWERAVGGATEMRSGYDLRTVRRSLNLLLAEWANRGINLWTVEQGEIPLLTGVAEYALPPDTVDLLEHVTRQNPGNMSTQTDLNITRISISTYSTIPNKLVRGLPIQIYIDRQRDNPRVFVWPTPQDDSYTLVYWRLRRLQDAGNGTNTQDIPFRFLPALISGLAYYLAQKLPEGTARVEALALEYEKQWQFAADEDREKAAVRFVPRRGIVGRRA